MQKLTAADANEYRMLISWKVWTWAPKEATDLFFGYIGQETKEGILFPHVPTYLVNQFNQACYAKLQRARAERARLCDTCGAELVDSQCPGCGYNH